MSALVSRARVWRDHRWAPGHMSAYLDDELASRSRVRMERHAGECTGCRRVLEGLRRMLGVIHGLPRTAGGADGHRIASAVRHRLGEPPAPH